MKKITIDYDKEADVLYVSFGDPEKAITKEHDNIGIRISEESKEIVGFTIIGFLSEIKKQKPIKISI